MSTPLSWHGPAGHHKFHSTTVKEMTIEWLQTNCLSWPRSVVRARQNIGVAQSTLSMPSTCNTLQYGGCLMVTIELDVKEGNWFANQWQFGNHFYLGLGSIDDTRQAGLSSQGYWISGCIQPGWASPAKPTPWWAQVLSASQKTLPCTSIFVLGRPLSKQSLQSLGS